MKNKKSIRIALVSMKHLYHNPKVKGLELRGDLDANLQRHESWIEKALEHDPDFIGFPEFSLTGWISDPRQALTLGSAPLRRVEALARKHRIHLATCFVERKGGTLHNNASVFSPRGWVGCMRKINLVGAECPVYRPGREYPVFNIAGARFGIAICADSSYYETFHLLSLRGAEVIFAPHANSLGSLGNNRAAWVKWRTEQWTPWVKSLKVAVAGMSCAGLGLRPRKDEEPYKYCGGGMIMNHEGKILTKADGPSKKEALLVADIDLHALRQAREKHYQETTFRADIVYNRPDGWDALQQRDRKWRHTSCA